MKLAEQVLSFLKKDWKKGDKVVAEVTPKVSSLNPAVATELNRFAGIRGIVKKVSSKDTLEMTLTHYMKSKKELKWYEYKGVISEVVVPYGLVLLDQN